eukprot:gnl/TRDRNA2_/TRDRNA2_188961_c0_seq1.p1 gnl/TRDRNA2_/TRDRNA2_188961_c0~~gnl/TRDRNA2_/TRDRNA2_188961_c0_seq1.p1  ORF type:complete len:193 (-),score=39.01 gnl/TRDRNA2_/TRDRNA2_188961_c0_seq1:39-617(-)
MAVPPPPDGLPPLSVEQPERKVAESVFLLLGAEMVRTMGEQCGSLEASWAQLEAIGFSTGMRLVTRLTATRFPITAEQGALKFVCKELWGYLFRKDASRLQADRRGNYIIQDTAFRWLQQFVPPEGGRPADEEALREVCLAHLAFPCGLIRGALLAIGVECSVTADLSVATLPGCNFTVALKEVQQEGKGGA